MLARLDEYKFERFVDAIKNQERWSNVSMNVGMMDQSTYRLGASFLGHVCSKARKKINGMKQLKSLILRMLQFS